MGGPLALGAHRVGVEALAEVRLKADCTTIRMEVISRYQKQATRSSGIGL